MDSSKKNDTGDMYLLTLYKVEKMALDVIRPRHIIYYNEVHIITTTAKLLFMQKYLYTLKYIYTLILSW